MKQFPVPKAVDTYLTKKLSGSVFTWREIMDLLIPGVLDSLSIMFINSLITALISANGEESMAAVSLVGPITWLAVYMFSGLSSGGTVIVAQCLGKKDEGQLKCAMSMTMWLTVLVGVIVCLPFLLFPEWILRTLYPSAEAGVMEKACVYLSGCMWSVLVFTLYTAAFAILRGLGESKRCLALSVLINVAYFVFSVLFLNILKMDIAGSVWALLLARSLGAVAALMLLYLWKPPVRLQAKQLLLHDRALFRDTMRVSIPLGLEQICISLGNIVAEMYMIPLGTSAVATHAIANSLLGVLNSPAMSTGGLAVAVVGRCIGAGKQEEAYTYGKRCRQIACILLIVTGLIFFPLLPVLLNQYHPTAEASQLATNLLLCSIPFLLLFWPMSSTMPSTLRAASDSAVPTAISLSVLWVVNIGLGYLLAIPAGLGLWGVWIATWSSWAVRALAFGIRFRRRNWLKKARNTTAA